MKFKWLLGLILLALIIVGMTACSSYTPDAGHEVVLIEKPMIFGHGGVDPSPVRAGRSYAAFTTEGIDVYMQPMKYETELPDTMTKDGVPITFHAIMVIKVNDSVARDVILCDGNRIHTCGVLSVT